MLKIRFSILFKMIGLVIGGAMMSLLINTYTWACDIAVVSASATTDGRPVIWKNRDYSNSPKEQVDYFEAETDAGGYIMVHDYSDVLAILNNGDKINSSGGVNESGFAITCTTVYEANLIHELVNYNTVLIRQALSECVTLDDFEYILSIWHEDNPYRVISGNFVVIDAFGGAALYECYTGEQPLILIFQFDNHIRYYKCDANNGEITYRDEDLFEVIEEGDEENFPGFFNITNSNTFIANPGEYRRWRAYDLLTEMAATDRLNYRNVMQELAKDLVDGRGNDEELNDDPESYYTTYCISRSATRLGMVVNGVPPGGDEKTAAFWCNLGEPSIGVFTPYFPHARGVSYLAWAEAIDDDENLINDDASSMLNLAIRERETYDHLLYTSNTGSELFGMNDNRINKIELARVQEWTFPLEDFIVNKTEAFLAELMDDVGRITDNNMLDFSDFCAEYAYENYTHASDSYYEWTYSYPWVDSILPAVITMNPGDSAVDVPVDINISATFNKSMAPSTMNDSTFILSNDSDEISGTVTYNDSTNIINFKPYSELDTSVEYTAKITTSASDKSGNSLANDYIWSFTITDSATDPNPDDDSEEEEKGKSGDLNNLLLPFLLNSDSSTDGCSSAAIASTHFNSSRPVLPGIISSLLMMLFPLSIILFHRAIRRRRKRV